MRMSTPTTPSKPDPVYRVRKQHKETLNVFTLQLSAKTGRRLSLSDALYLLSRYGLEHMDQVAEYIRADLPSLDTPEPESDE